jgi:hypothetical protein
MRNEWQRERVAQERAASAAHAGEILSSATSASMLCSLNDSPAQSADSGFDKDDQDDSQWFEYCINHTDSCCISHIEFFLYYFFVFFKVVFLALEIEHGQCIFSLVFGWISCCIPC